METKTKWCFEMTQLFCGCHHWQDTCGQFHQPISSKRKCVGTWSLAQSFSMTKLQPTLPVHTTRSYALHSMLNTKKISVHLLARKLHIKMMKLTLVAIQESILPNFFIRN